MATKPAATETKRRHPILHARHHTPVPFRILHSSFSILHSLFFFALLLVSLFPAAVAGETGTHYAGLVIDFGDGQVETHCVSFQENTISGYDLLSRAGVDVLAAFEAAGAAVCAIDGVGCPLNDCLCESSPPNYWSYWHLQDGAWVYSNLGASIYQVTGGVVDGWLWGDASQPPPVIPLEQICDISEAEATATATPTATPTHTPKPPTATPLPPTPTWTPAPTPEPSVRFWAANTAVQAGNCTTLHWQTDHVQAVFFQGQGMPGIGAKTVCPCQDSTYVLQVAYHDGGREDFQASVEVVGTCSSEPSATLSPSPTPEPAATAAPPAGTPTPELLAQAMTATPTSGPMQGDETAPSLPTSTLLPQPSATPVISAPASEDATNPATPTSTPLPHYEVEGMEETKQGQSRAWIAYLVFGVLLMGLGAAYMVMTRSTL